MPPRPEERPPGRRSATPSSSQTDLSVRPVAPSGAGKRTSPRATPAAASDADRPRSARRPSGVSRVKPAPQPAAGGPDPLESSWVLQGSGNFATWQSGDLVEGEVAASERDDGSGLGLVREPRERGGGQRVVPALTPELLAWLEERVTRRVTVAVHEAIHEALTRERGSLRAQREALAQAVEALERKRQELLARREALRQGEARVALAAATCRCQGSERRASSA